MADAVTTDAGLDSARARLLAVGLVGLSQVAAQYWLDSEQTVARDEAVALLAEPGVARPGRLPPGPLARPGRAATPAARSTGSMCPAPGTP